MSTLALSNCVQLLIEIKTIMLNYIADDIGWHVAVDIILEKN
jgi:hypothetical protein